ncbi:MAG: hypothetical protein NTY14_08610 [Candidatus Omnitrophica bacterium]|nr:hypothetical protein [Candidatus Omnitrophota bacterium]
MTFDELKSQVKTCGFEEVRMDNNELFEAVILKKGLGALMAKLTLIFGPPAWPSENKLSNEVQNIIQHYGGIMPGQSLYFTHLDSDPVFVMFWPWGDKEHITVKIGKKTE